ncbi:MAG: hypothetical protein IJP09_02530 [Clostridia bacterium]|nr:hypothetical protein [Clostridia bacterium]
MDFKKALLTLGLATVMLTAACGNEQAEPVELAAFNEAETNSSKVVEMIDAITAVDFTTEAAIDDAFLAYCSLTDSNKEKVTNYEKLEEYRAQLAKLYNTEVKQGERMDRSKINIGTYCVYAPCYTDEGIKAIADCGIDFLTNPGYNDGLFDLLEKYNLGAFVSGVVPGWYTGGDVGGTTNAGTMSSSNPLTAYDNGIESFVDRDCIWGIDVGDEPWTVDLPHFGDVIDHLIEGFPGKAIYLNLLPGFANGAEATDKYLETYVENVNTDYICYDHYVYAYLRRTHEENFDFFLGDLQHAQKICNENDRDFWIVLQANSNFDRPLTEDEIRIQASLALTYGVRTISWACWQAGWFNYNIADSNGNPTEVYDYVKAVNEEIHIISPVISRYDSVVSGFIGKDPKVLSSNVNTDAPTPVAEFKASEIENCSISEIKTDENSMIFAGYFEKNEGEGSAVMFTNTSDYYCAENPVSIVYFTVKDAEAKVMAYYNGEAFEPENLENGQYKISIRNSDNILVTIG